MKNIGGQAVIEGVMMRNKQNYAVAVRLPDGKIRIKKEMNAMIKEIPIPGHHTLNFAS